jgi:integrase
MGTIYKRGLTYWIKYYQNGKPFFESSKSHKKMVASMLLKQREGDISQGKIPGIYFERVTFEDLSKDFLRDYEINKKKSIAKAKRSINHLKESFEDMKANRINTIEINAYIQKRLNEGVANASINRELAALKRMMNIGARQTPPKVDRVPYIPMLKENNARKGFFEHDEFLTLRDELPFYLKGFVTFAYKLGWRVSEITGLKWSQVDRDNGIVRLEPGETKNDEGRTVYLDMELKEIINTQWELRKQSQRVLHCVFPNRTGTDHIKDFRFPWNKAFEDAKVERKLFHDLRRTAIRNMVRAGIPEGVAMKISGHKTRSVFDRYNIVSGSDLKEAALKQEKYLNG